MYHLLAHPSFQTFLSTVEHKGDIIITVIIVLEVVDSQNYLAAKKY